MMSQRDGLDARSRLLASHKTSPRFFDTFDPAAQDDPQGANGHRPCHLSVCFPLEKGGLMGVHSGKISDETILAAWLQARKSPSPSFSNGEEAEEPFLPKLIGGEGIARRCAVFVPLKRTIKSIMALLFPERERNRLQTPLAPEPIWAFRIGQPLLCHQRKASGGPQPRAGIRSAHHQPTSAASASANSSRRRP